MHTKDQGMKSVIKTLGNPDSGKTLKIAKGKQNEHYAVYCDHLSYYDFLNKPGAGNSRKNLALLLTVSDGENGMLCGGVAYTFKKKMLKNWNVCGKSN